MVACVDKATTYLAAVGYNVVRHPSADIKVLELVGVRRGTAERVGMLDKVVLDPGGTFPTPETDIPAADVRSVETSKLSAAIGASLLGALVGAMGGNLGLRLDYTNARRIQVLFTNVSKDRVRPDLVGDFLRDGDLDAGHPTFNVYVVGSGRLYVITETLKASSFAVRYERSNNVGAKVDADVLATAVGANVGISVDKDSKHVVSYSGSTPLVFGFKCYELRIQEGSLAMISAKPGGVALATVLGADGFPIDNHARLLTEPDQPLLEFGSGG